MDVDVNTVRTWNTVYTPDCVDFCPVEGFQHIFIVGTYQLTNTEENSDTKPVRKGRIYLLTFSNEEIKVLQEIEMDGILDAKWCPHSVNGNIILAIASAKGDLLVYSLNQMLYSLDLIHTVKATSSLSLYVDWSNVLSDHPVPQILVSDSEGKVTCYSMNSQLEPLQRINGHLYEAWIACFNYWNPAIVYSGGDDNLFKGYDLRCNPCNVAFINKEHNAGVTSIQQCLHKEHVLLSGSYDEEMRIWDSRLLKKPQYSINLGGGVWRLRSEPQREPLILASCMHNGFKILRLDDTDKPVVVTHYSKHESLAYGAEWSKQINRDEQYLIASVSFYDHLLCIWNFRKKSKT